MIDEAEMPAELTEAMAASEEAPVANDNGDTTKAGEDRPHPARGRQPLPPYLPVEIIEHPICTCPHCGGDQFSKVGETRRAITEYVPAHVKIIEHVRPKMSCRQCERIIQAPMPPLPIERGRAGSHLSSTPNMATISRSNGRRRSWRGWA